MSNSRPSNFRCDKCKDTGYEPFEKTRADGIITTWVQPCACKYPAFKAYAFGEKFKDKTLENYEGRTPSMEAAKLALITNPDKSYFITGAVGLGKTHLMAGIYGRIVHKYGSKIIVLTEAQLADAIRYKEDKVDPRSFKVAMIDDIGKIKLTDWQYDKFFEFFNDIYRRDRQLVISSNYSIEELVREYGGAIARRIDEKCEIIEIKGPEVPSNELFEKT